MDAHAHILKHLDVKVRQLADALHLSGSLAKEPTVLLSTLSAAAERITFGLKTYIWGGDPAEHTYRRPDGPLERWKLRHQWSQCILGRVRYKQTKVRIEAVYPDLNLSLDALPSGTLTARVSSAGDPATTINIVRVRESELAALRYSLYTHLKPGGEEALDKFIERFTIPYEVGR